MRAAVVTEFGAPLQVSDLELGHIAVQYARAMGLRVVAIDIDDSKLALADGTRPDRRPHRHRRPKGLTARGRPREPE